MLTDDHSVADPLVPTSDGAIAGPGSGGGGGVGALSDGDLAAHVRGLVRRRTVAEVEPGRGLLGRDLLTALDEVDRRHRLHPE